MKLGRGAYRVQLAGGTTTLVVANDAQAAAVETWLKQQSVQGVSKVQGGAMAQFSHTIRPVGGVNATADGPWVVISRNPDGTDFNYTTQVASVGAALDQAKVDGAAILSAASATAKNIDIFTTF